MELFNVIKLPSGKGDTVPDYLLDVSLQEIYAYFFNWNVDLKEASLEIISQWYAKKHWTWEPA